MKSHQGLASILCFLAALCAAAPLPITVRHGYHRRGEAASAEPLAPTTADIMTSLTSISKALDSMSAATKAYDSGVIKFIAIKQAEDGLMAQIQTATKQLAKSPPLATADNAAVAGEMGEVLPKVGGVAKAIASKARPIKKAGIDSVVLTDIGALQKSTAGLGNAMIKVVTPETVPPVKQAMKALDQVFKDVAVAFK